MKTISRSLASPTRVAILLGFVCTGLVGASFFVQHVLGIEPCPLCIIQRFTYLGLIPVFFAAAMTRPHGRAQRALLWTAAILTVAGLGVAGYQTYLQLNPAQLVARCSASLSYMLDNMAVTEVLARLLHATGDCSDTSFKVLGLTLAQASVLMFLSITLSLVMLLRRQPAAT
jgi:disulfide bond formation protein DsbB